MRDGIDRKHGRNDSFGDTFEHTGISPGFILRPGGHNFSVQVLEHKTKPRFKQKECCGEMKQADFSDETSFEISLNFFMNAAEGLMAELDITSAIKM